MQTTLARAKEQGKTIVLTTHDFALGLELCDRALILHCGRLSWQSTGRLPSVPEFVAIYHLETQSSVLSPQSSVLSPPDC